MSSLISVCRVTPSQRIISLLICVCLRDASTTGTNELVYFVVNLLESRAIRMEVAIAVVTCSIFCFYTFVTATTNNVNLVLCIERRIR